MHFSRVGASPAGFATAGILESYAHWPPFRGFRFVNCQESDLCPHETIMKLEMHSTVDNTLTGARCAMCRIANLRIPDKNVSGLSASAARPAGALKPALPSWRWLVPFAAPVATPAVPTILSTVFAPVLDVPTPPAKMRLPPLRPNESRRICNGEPATLE